MRIRLTDEDRARLGCPEWLEVNLDHCPIELAEAIEVAGGEWRRFRAGGPRSIKLWVWVGLRNAGVEVDLAELTFDVGEVEEEKEDPGKAPSPDSDGSTSSTSSSSVE